MTRPVTLLSTRHQFNLTVDAAWYGYWAIDQDRYEAEYDYGLDRWINNKYGAWGETEAEAINELLGQLEES